MIQESRFNVSRDINGDKRWMENYRPNGLLPGFMCGVITCEKSAIFRFGDVVTLCHIVFVPSFEISASFEK